MNESPIINTIRVFVDEKKQFGSPLGIVVDEKSALSATTRQDIATKLNYSETVFINSVTEGNISVYSPIRECPFSMYAALGVAWYIFTQLNNIVNQLVSRNQTIKVYKEAELVWVESPVAILPNWNFEQYQTPKEVEDFTVEQCTNKEHVFMWAWIDELKGTIRARTFASDWGIPEDEANGSGSMRLTLLLGLPITVVHGKGSVIYAKPHGDSVLVGGRCSL